MTAHELARLLLSMPDLPVAICDLEYNTYDGVQADDVHLHQVQPRAPSAQPLSWHDDWALGEPGTPFIALNGGAHLLHAPRQEERP
jgi:hypothetical protein